MVFFCRTFQLFSARTCQTTTGLYSTRKLEVTCTVSSTPSASTFGQLYFRRKNAARDLAKKTKPWIALVAGVMTLYVAIFLVGSVIRHSWKQIECPICRDASLRGSKSEVFVCNQITTVVYIYVVVLVSFVLWYGHCLSSCESFVLRDMVIAPSVTPRTCLLCVHLEEVSAFERCP